jgi:hypothetical protein
MTYFTNFPVTRYDFGNQQITLVHILRRFNVQKLIKDNIRVYQEYHIQDGDTPDSLASDWYDDSFKYWIILLFNDIVDPLYGWPLIHENLIAYCNYKYGNLTGIHHYESASGLVVEPSLYDGITSSVTNLEYETRLNDAKRKIRIPQKEHAIAIAAEAEQILKTT